MRIQTIELARASAVDSHTLSEAYELWTSVYTPIAEAAGVQLQPESFHRSQFITLIRDEEKILSFFLSSFWDLTVPGVNKLGYFKPMSEMLFERFKRNCPRVMTIEWVTVHPESRGKLSKIRQSDLIMGSAMKVFERSAADIAMGFSRVDLGAVRIAEQFGCEQQEQTSMFGIDCRVMMINRKLLKPHPFAVVQRAIDDLWIPRSVQIAA